MRTFSVFTLLLVFKFTGGIVAQSSLPSFVKNGPVENYFLTISNELKLKINGADVSRIDLKSSGAYLAKVNDSLYTIRFNDVEDGFKVKLYYKSLPVDVLTASVQPIPIPKFELNDLKKNEISLEQLIEDEIELKFPIDYQPNIDISLYSFQLTLQDPQKMPVMFNIRENTIPKNVVNMIKNSSDGSKLVLDKFRFKTKANNVFEVNGDPLIYNIKL